MYYYFACTVCSCHYFYCAKVGSGVVIFCRRMHFGFSQLVQHKYPEQEIEIYRSGDYDV